MSVIGQVNDENLRILFDNLEADTKAKALQFEELFKNRCRQGCSSSVNSCSQTLPNIKCFSDFTVDKCTDCDEPGIQLSATSTIKLADVYDPPSSPTDKKVKEAACTTLQGESILEKADKMIKWRYVGTYNGVYRNYPGVNSCKKYDPRIRPWYVGAATGAKNVVLIMDTSRLMNEGRRLDIAKKAAEKVVETLNNFDWVGLVSFSTEASKYSDQLVPATQLNKEQINEWIKNLIGSGSTNFENAFRAGYSILSDLKEDEFGTECENIIILLTDSDLKDEGDDEGKKLLDTITTLDKGYNARLIIYSLGNVGDYTIAKKIACQRKGFFREIISDLNLEQAMNDYYLLLSAGMDSNKVIWTEPYEDNLNMGLITTVAYPIYDRTVSPPFLIGVLGQDVIMTELEKYADSDNILSQFIARSRACNKFSLSECQMDSLREEKCGSSTESCSPIKSSLEDCTVLEDLFDPNTILLSTSNNSEAICCNEDTCGSSNTGAIVGGVVGGVVVILIIVILIVWWYRSKKEEGKKDEEAPPRKTQWKRTKVENNNEPHKQPGSS
eukprot:CAMPEP_0170517622 /NCGR_PEP_ID=MMETSP0209-20121228/3545_1 /TAXON_ID=665100 ORGANISM="Litonotus pictus, Strain P1" /NCGR_SAMPLE_ID=MMETSP0209 /ASSEMBLY_ACC=CAM_ASM_000301 /LENGTH=554 /DNA_ID=CAMNT_0010802911 /DNA_START=101 /DNA_END=1765 /DNA_ORIENTATION=+